MIGTVSGISTRKLQSKPTYNRYQRKVKFSEISKFAVYLHITCLYFQAPQWSEMTSRTETSFGVIEYTTTNLCTCVQRVMWFLSVGLCKVTSVCGTFTTEYWWTKTSNKLTVNATFTFICSYTTCFDHKGHLQVFDYWCSNCVKRH
jgi:hypothetical protein